MVEGYQDHDGFYSITGAWNRSRTFIIKYLYILPRNKHVVSWISSFMYTVRCFPILGHSTLFYSSLPVSYCDKYLFILALFILNSSIKLQSHLHKHIPYVFSLETFAYWNFLQGFMTGEVLYKD